MVAPRFEQLSKQYPNVQFLKVNVDQHQDISGKYGVRAMPTFLFFKNGSKLDEVVGADINKVERLTAQYASGGSSTFQGKGHRLGDGATATPSKGITQDQWVYIIVFGLLIYLFFTK